MRFDHVIASTVLLLAGVCLCTAESAVAQELRPKSAFSPSLFGKVFRSCKGAMIRVRSTQRPELYATGFLLGAQGEVLFGLEGRGLPEEELVVVTSAGHEHRATLLGSDPKLGLAVARLEGAPQATPLPVSELARMAPQDWVVVLSHDAKGKPEPYAGVVTAAARSRAQRGGSVRLAPVEAPGDRGSPVLSLDGELVGVVVRGGRRRSEVAPIQSIAPFLKAVVLGD